MNRIDLDISECEKITQIIANELYENFGSVIRQLLRRYYSERREMDYLLR